MKYADIDLRLLVPTFASREVNPNKLEDARYAGLKALMAVEGCLQPILVFELPNKKFKIVDGHHRFWIVQELGVKSISCIIADVEDKAQALALAMNRLRGELDLTLSAEIMREVFVETGWSGAQLALNTGFTEQEVAGLLESAKTYGDVDLTEMGAGAPPEDNMAPPDRPFVLEISFTNKDDMRLARKKLKKAAGKGGDLGTGLLHVLGESE